MTLELVNTSQESQNRPEAEPFSRPCSIDVLRDRAYLLAEVRAFFAQRGVLEVDLPALNRWAPIDLYIDPMVVEGHGSRPEVIGYLHTSPEYGMKQLLAYGSGDIYQLSHVFRQGERGRRHRSEFTMIEWYRLGYSLEEMIEETAELIQLFAEGTVTQMTYQEALAEYTPLASLTPKQGELNQAAVELGIDLREPSIDQLFACAVEPHLNGLVAITDFPPDQAALAQVVEKEGVASVQRFELFLEGVEVANGYLELLDCNEHERRMRQANQKRRALGKKSYACDPGLHDAMKRGLPECSGVAVGFDRLMMVRHRVEDIQAILPLDSVI